MLTSKNSKSEKARKAIRSSKKDNNSSPKVKTGIVKNKLSDFIGILSEKSGRGLLNSIQQGRNLSRLRAKRLMTKC